MPNMNETIPTNGDYSGYTGSANELLAYLKDPAHANLKPKFKVSFLQESALTPAELRTSRDAKTIADYLDGNPMGIDGKPLTPEARQQLIHRIANLAYYDRLADRFREYSDSNSYTDYKGSARELLDYLQENPAPMEKPSIGVPFAEKKMKIPLLVNCTGDVDIIAKYLDNDPRDSEGKPLSAAARRHLIDRMVTSVYVDRRAEEFKNKKYIPLPARELKKKVTTNGETKEETTGYVLQGIHQPERQGTMHCCWSMPIKLMLQSRGIHLDQETIRCYTPELSEEFLNRYMDNYVKGASGLRREDAIDEEDVSEYTENIDSTSDALAFLVNKFVPNCMMAHRTFIVPMMRPDNDRDVWDRDNMEKVFKRTVKAVLSQHRSPIAMNFNGHYRTIVGIEGDDLIVKDSLSVHLPDTNYKVPIRSLFSTSNAYVDIFFLRDLTVEKGGVLPKELEGKGVYVEDSGEDTGKLKLSRSDCKHQEKVGYGDCISMWGSFSYPGKLPKQIYYDKQHWIIPKTMNENVITLPMPQEAYAEAEAELEQNTRRLSAPSGAVAVSERIAQESSFLTELPDGDYKRIMDIANDARHELHYNSEPWINETPEEKPEREALLRRCMLAMLYAKLVEVERALGNGKPGKLEKEFSQATDLDKLLENETVLSFYRQCPKPEEITPRIAEDFIINDTVGKLVRDSLTQQLENGRHSPAALAAAKKKVLNGTDPVHETQRLRLLYERLQKADPALMRSSTEFKTMKKNLETVIRLREDQTELLSGKLSPEQKQQSVSALVKAYVDLGASAKDYLNIKNPALLKEGSTARSRYDVAVEVMNFAGELRMTHLETYAAIPKQPAVDANQRKAAPTHKANLQV